MTDKRDEDSSTSQDSGTSAMPEPNSGAGYGNDAEELQKRSEQDGEEKSA